VRTLRDAVAVAADAAGGIDLGVLAQYGVLGIFAAILVWFARGAHQRERERADRLEEKNNQLNELIRERIIPALISATKAVQDSGELLAAVQREREALRLIDERRTSPRSRDATD
jgi:hypothetical protein